MPRFWEELKEGEIIEVGDRYAKDHPYGINWQPVTDEMFGPGEPYQIGIFVPVQRYRSV